MLLALLVAALLVPVVLALHISGDSAVGIEVSARIRVLGVIRITRRRRTGQATPAASGVPVAATPPPDGAPSPTEPSAAPPARAARWQQRARRLWDRAALLRCVLERGAVRIDHPAGWLEYALADVAETGQLYGFVCATSVLVDPDGAVTVTPLWSTTNWLAVELTFAARVYPLRLALVLAQERLAGRRRSRAAADAEELRAHVA